MQCMDPPEKNFASVLFASLSVDSVAIYTCARNYMFSDGTTTRTTSCLRADELHTVQWQHISDECVSEYAVH